MKKIVNITNNPKQHIFLQNEKGEDIDFYLEYKPRVEGWFFSFKYNELESNNLQVCIHPNILRQFIRVINFGIGFVSKNNAEPFSLDSFSADKCEMYLLNKEDILKVESEIYGENS